MRPLPRTRRAGRFNLAKSARSLFLFGPDLAALTAAVLPCEYQQKSAYVRIGFPEFGKRAAWSFAKLLRRSGRHRESGTTIAILVASDGFLASLGTSRLARSPFLALLAAVTAPVLAGKGFLLGFRAENLAPLSILKDDLIATLKDLKGCVDLTHLVELHRARLAKI